MNQILRRQTSRSHYGSKVPAVTVTVFKYRNKIGKIVAFFYATSHWRSCYVCVTIPQVIFLVSFVQNKKRIRLGLFLYYIWLILILYLTYSYIIFNLFLYYIWLILILYLTYSYVLFGILYCSDDVLFFWFLFFNFHFIFV